MGTEDRQDSAKRRKELLAYLRKLAKGKNNDVVRLAFLEPGNLEVVDRLDLTGVAEFKRNANGALEVKFVDRVKVLAMLRELAELLGGDWAVTRPLVEKGWAGNDRQIGLSGRTVRPRLIITCGVSGAIQFTACMNASEHIVAINTDRTAPIFETAHVAIVGDLYETIPVLINELKEARA